MASQSFPESYQGLVEGAGAGFLGWPQALGTRSAASLYTYAALNKHACTKSAAQTCITTGLSPS